jgi:hypothetical protein
MTPEIAQAREAADNLRAHLPKEIDVAALGVKAKAPYQLLCARESLAWRVEELARNACDALERDDFAAAGLLVRGATETVALVWKLMDVLDDRNNHAPEELNNVLMSALVDWKKEPGELPEAYNVLTLVQRMDRAIGGGVAGTFDNLSELARPNWGGTLALYGKTDRENFITYFGRALRDGERHATMIANALLGALGAYEYAYNKISDEMPGFLAELESL